MVIKCVKYSLVGLGATALIGGVVFGTDLLSYVRSSAKSVQTAVKDSVPVEFELRRARDMVEQIIPELHANIRLIAQEEVEVAALQRDIEQSTEKLTAQRRYVARLRSQLDPAIRNKPIRVVQLQYQVRVADILCTNHIIVCLNTCLPRESKLRPGVVHPVDPVWAAHCLQLKRTSLPVGVTNPFRP